MKLQDDSIEIKMQINVKSLLSTHRSWSTVQNAKSGKDLLSNLVQQHEEDLQDLADFDKERWKDLLRRRVIDKEWGEKKTLQEIEDYFELQDEEREWIKKWIQIFRKVRLEDMDVERAKRTVEHDRDPNQRRLA